MSSRFSMKLTLVSGFALSFLISPGLLHAQAHSNSNVQSSLPSNQAGRDSYGTGILVQPSTSDRQRNDRMDSKISQDIKRAIVADPSLSTVGHKIKVSTRNGAVTLKGSVESVQEKQAIMTDAGSVARVGKITDKIVVKTSAKS